MLAERGDMDISCSPGAIRSWNRALETFLPSVPNAASALCSAECSIPAFLRAVPLRARGIITIRLRRKSWIACASLRRFASDTALG